MPFSGLSPQRTVQLYAAEAGHTHARLAHDLALSPQSSVSEQSVVVHQRNRSPTERPPQENAQAQTQSWAQAQAKAPGKAKAKAKVRARAKAQARAQAQAQAYARARARAQSQAAAEAEAQPSLQAAIEEELQRLMAGSHDEIPILPTSPLPQHRNSVSKKHRRGRSHGINGRRSSDDRTSPDSDLAQPSPRDLSADMQGYIIDLYS